MIGTMANYDAARGSHYHRCCSHPMNAQLLENPTDAAVEEREGSRRSASCSTSTAKESVEVVGRLKITWPECCPFGFDVSHRQQASPSVTPRCFGTPSVAGRRARCAWFRNPLLINRTLW